MSEVTEIYRVTRKGFGPRRPTIGTKTAAIQTAAYAKSLNDYYKRAGFPDLVSVTIERAPVGEFTDVTAEFMGEGQ